MPPRRPIPIPPRSPKLKIQNSASLAEAVDRYTVNRAREHGTYRLNITPWPYRHSPPPHLTEFRHCPCGQACPCPSHESEEFGPYPEIFWKVSPFHPVYRDCLRDRNLPYREPREYLP